MPARIDRGARFRELCAIATRIVAAEGLQAPTVRRVATEADLSPSSVRHLFPTQELLLLRTAQSIRERWDDRWPSWHLEVDLAERARRVVQALVPADEEDRVRAQAWAAFASAAHGDAPLAELVRDQGKRRANAVGRLLETLRWLALPEPRPSLVVRASDVRSYEPNTLDPEALELLVVAAGLTTLICDHEIPLSIEAATRWLSWWKPPQLDSNP